MSIEVAAPPSPQPKAASTGLSPGGRLKVGAPDGESTHDTGSFSTLLATQDPLLELAKEDSPQDMPLTNPPALDLAALLALAGQAEAARASASTAVGTSMADAQPGSAKPKRAAGAVGLNGLLTNEPQEVLSTQRTGAAAGAPVNGSLLAGTNGVPDPLSVPPDLTDSRQSAASAARAAEKLESHGARLEAFSREPGLAGLLAASGLGDGLVRQSGANLDKPSGRLAIPSFEGSGDAMQAGSGASGEIMAPPEVVTVQTTDTMLADTLSYWVSQGVQKAELKLDGFGAEPVEVSISLANGEAQIGFRTDRADVREVIEGAMSHLKELLASEGLVLAGVSVGTAGQDRAGAQAQRERAGVRQKGISLVEPDVALAAPRPRGVSGRTVDLFV
ncbi:MAG: flagellar hook-length control protein FliK [Burkholderiales bacterium]|nr:flagellar hook-length control protein FliK [Burkholderiales bacterium]